MTEQKDLILNEDDRCQVEIDRRHDGKHVLYVHVNGITILRILHPKKIEGVKLFK